MGQEKKPIQEEGQEKNNVDDEICDASVETASANANADDDKKIEEVVEEEVVVRSDKTFHERMLLIMEKFASYQMGQEVMLRTDRMLKALEETAKWSLPTAPDVKLQRPLPWIPFLALLILLRMARFWCSVVSFATRLHPVRPQEMVYFFQNRRRTLRVVRINGLKTIRNREQQPSLVCRHQTVRNIDEGFLRRLRSLLSGPACRPCEAPGTPRPHAFAPFGRKMTLDEVRAEIEAEDRLPLDEPSTSKDNADGPRKRARRSKKRKDDDRDLTIDEMLEKYGNEDSNDTDSDYDPRDEDNTNTSNCTSSAEETEKEKEAAEAIVHNENAENVENMENNDNEVKENGNSKPVVANERKSESETDSGKEGAEANENGSSETVEQNSDSGESNAATPEVAPQNHASTPITNKRTNLAVASLQEEENTQKSTPGHVTAASQKTPVVTNSSTGSPQDFHSIFHPASIVKGSTTEDFHFSTTPSNPPTNGAA